ncbi:hypothetical protein C4577_07400 [Candidatus Parcubacteria bacterium]|nr:MAG: hypothetical protein C4577_07400 [Candidatus Parcubacteria bacterium]
MDSYCEICCEDVNILSHYHCYNCGEECSVMGHLGNEGYYCKRKESYLAVGTRKIFDIEEEELFGHPECDCDEEENENEYDWESDSDE